MGSEDVDDSNTGYNARVEEFRDEEYPMLKDQVYLDHAGTTPYPKSLMDAFAKDMMSNLLGNPHSASASSQLSTSRIEDIRLRALQFFNADPNEFDLVFVANATAGIKLVADAFRARPHGFSYAYFEDSHTSLVGVREEAEHSLCLDAKQFRRWIFTGKSPFPPEIDESRPVLLGYPAQSNMTGRRYPPTPKPSPDRHNTYALLDAASLVSCSPLDLSCVETAPDFTVLSFYKIFGFPDLGALIVKRTAEDVFDSTRYFGGGTVDMVVCLKEQWHIPKRQSLHERLEYGTLPIHNILALDAAMDVHARLFGSMRDVSAHTVFLHKRLFRGLKSLRHENGKRVCKIYSFDPDGVISSPGGFGPIVAFNIRNSQGAWISLAEVEKLATLKRFHIRTGGVCNPGGIAKALNLKPWEMKQNFSSGFRCGTDNDIMGERPTGVIRVSLGAMSTIADVDSFVDFIAEFYRHLSPPSLVPRPVPQPDKKAQFRVCGVHIYPIKSCGRFEVPRGVNWEVRPEGLAWDREWCLVHHLTGRALSQKQYPRMALIRPTLDFDSGVLWVKYTGPGEYHEIKVPLSQDPALFVLPSVGRERAARVCGEAVNLHTYSDQDVNNFFSDVLGVQCRLARFPPGGQGTSMRHNKAHLQKHQVQTAAPSQPVSMPGSSPERPPSPPDSESEKTVERRILLSNESPILAITLASVDALNQEISKAGTSDEVISPTVFRANIILGPASDSTEESITEPYEEDTWSRIRIGPQEHEFDMLGSCRRCHMVCINQKTAVKSQEPFVTLSKTRRFDGKVFFGVHMCYSGKSKQLPTVKVGDWVTPERAT
ncbi:putative molybdenum cofactor sulfurase [Podospora australis]|uniref:Molybdenum cofactor sulfurase n=1 Tax=Podospora australis TaxID=1536484 RepID=A0AAN7AQ36_9PEZI|nr:putative molybdenum cofactor sulfurase [Podospora australis]